MFVKNLLTAISVAIVCVNMSSAKDLTPLHTAAASKNAVYLQDTSVSGRLEGDEDMVNIPFGKIKKQTSVNDITVINPTDLLTFDNITDVAQMLNGRVAGLAGGLNVRGLGNALVVIDGMPRSISSVSIQEIEQITVLKDANAGMLYGVQGHNGVILIKTKRGKPNKKVINGLIETGINDPVSFPNYLGAAEYMELFNEARVNDGLSPLYAPDVISGTRNGTDPTRYPDVNYYSSDFLKSTKPSSRGVAEFSGGNDNAQYYLNLGWTRSGSIMNKGGSNLHNDRLNIRSNIDFDVNKFIKSNIDIAGIFNLANTPTGNFFNDASTLRPNLFPGLIDTALITDRALLRTATLVEGRYVVGGSSLYPTNPYGYLNLGGFNKNLGVEVQFTNGLTFDLGALTKGLSLRTNLTFDFNNRYGESQTNTYAVYQTAYNQDGVLSLTRIGADRFSGAMSVGGTNLNREIGISALLDYSREFANKHAVSATLMGYADKYTVTDVVQSDKHSHLGARFNYAYANKYIFDFSGALVSSPKLGEGNRVAFSPSIGLGWVLSEESFLKGSSVIDFLKLKASGGIINTDMGITRYYSYEDIFAQGPGVTWNDGTKSNSATVLSNVGNSNLFYEKRKEYNLGLEALFFDKSLSLDFNVFQEIKSDLLTVPYNTYPAHAGGLVAMENFGENKYSGLELGINWRRSLSADFGFDIGPTLFFSKSEVVKTDEYWSEDYLYRAGGPISAMFGLEALGLFQSEADIAGHATQEYGLVRPGDIKYKDQNGDGVVNGNDEIRIGESAARFVGGLNIKLRYKNFTLFSLLTGRKGADQYFNSPYHWVYGDRKYSEVVRGRWTPETASTATYPRLTSQSSSNNFRNSTFWLYDNSCVSLDRMQLNYSLPAKLASRLYTRSFSFYVRANNIATFSKNRDMMELNIGTEPQYRSYLVGLKALF